MPAAPAVPFLILVLISFTGKRPRAPQQNSSHPLPPPIGSGIFLCRFFLSIGDLCLLYQALFQS